MSTRRRCPTQWFPLYVPSIKSLWLLSHFKSPAGTSGLDRSSVVVAPSSGPTVCLPLDDYIQLRQETAADVVSDGETASFVGCYHYIGMSHMFCFRPFLVINPGKHRGTDRRRVE